MVAKGSPGGVQVPSWLIRLGSVITAIHFGAVVVGALAAPSGPWPSMGGANLATPPQFAFSLNEIVTPAYLRWLRLTSNYHFPSNRPARPDAYFEVILRDESGQELKKLRFPEEHVNPWVRHRQNLLARALAEDEPVAPQQGEVIAPPNQPVPTFLIWDIEENRKLRLSETPQHLIPRDRPVFRPSDWSLLLAKSYARHLCRRHGASTAELIRHTKDPIPPAVLFMTNVRSEFFDELISNFGELPK